MTPGLGEILGRRITPLKLKLHSKTLHLRKEDKVGNKKENKAGREEEEEPVSPISRIVWSNG